MADTGRSDREVNTLYHTAILCEIKQYMHGVTYGATHTEHHAFPPVYVYNSAAGNILGLHCQVICEWLRPVSSRSTKQLG
jgi:hypothetical protein